MTSNDHLYQDNSSNDHEASSYCSVCYLNKGEEDEMEVYGYRRSKIRTIVTWTCIVLSLGIIRLIFHWYQHWMTYCTHRQCPLKYAQTVVVIDRYQGSHITYYVKPVRRVNLEELSSEDVAVVCNDPNMTDVTRLAKEVGSTVRMHFSDGSFTGSLVNLIVSSLCCGRFYIRTKNYCDTCGMYANVHTNDESDFIEINVKKLSYVWREDQHKFCKLAGIDKGFTKADLHSLQGYSAKEQLLRRIVYGNNEIKVKVNSLCELFTLEFLNPFYVFQAFSLILWFIEVYLYYSFAIIAMSLFGIILTIIQTQRNQKQLANTVLTKGEMTVCRHLGTSKYEAVYEDIPIVSLVPGDIIVIPRTGFVVPCDAVLLSGQCIVNESMLTGESVPVTKTSLPCINVPYAETEDGNHTLYCGTEVLQARYYANEQIHAVVLRTGYLTAKGSLIRSILYPLPHDFQFDRDVNRFVCILGCIAIVGTPYAFITKLLNGYSLFDTIIDSLDIITIVVPPALPAALSVGKYYAQDRLMKQKISCMNPAVINVSGSVNCVCFDKTGTLTEDGLDLYGVIPVYEQKLGPLQTNVHDGVRTNLKEAMACCHSLTLINGITSGDPLDVKMFEATGWILDETEVTDTIKYDLLAPTIVKSPFDNQEVGIIHQFQFSSRLQRMSVITRHLNSEHLTVYCKGSPEMIVSLTNPESVPDNLDTVLEKQTEKGYRVIAVGYRNIPAIDIIKLKRLHRDEVECNLTFAGLIIFENKLKPQTTSIISILKQARMNIVMLTGDNLQTAVCVARECGIVDPDDLVVHVNITKNNGRLAPQLTFKPCQNETSKFITRSSKIFSIQDIELGLKVSGTKRKFVISGYVWTVIRESFPQHIKGILQQGAIFARMSPDHKQQVIQELQKMEFYVAMCGDGANDCGALKTADVGISLSEAESSVASPFTSHQADISCVPKIIKEGRAALVTAVGLFKFMVLYSLLEFFSSVLLFTFNSSLSDMEFLYIDVFLIVVFAFFFGQTRAYSGPLVPKPPSSSLLSIIPLVSVFTQLLLMITMQILSDNLIKHFSWYSYRDQSEALSKPVRLSAELYTYDNYAVYTTSQFQYIILAITFSVGAPYRQPIYKNIPFFVSLLVMTLISMYITLFPAEFLRQLFELRLPPTLQFRYIIISLALITLVLSVLLESFVTNFVLTKIVSRKNKSNLFSKRYPSEVSEYIVNSSIRYLSEIEVKCYGTMK